MQPLHGSLGFPLLTSLVQIVYKTVLFNLSQASSYLHHQKPYVLEAAVPSYHTFSKHLILKRHCAIPTTILNVLLQLLTYLSVLKITQASVEKPKNVTLICHPNFNTDKTSIFYLHHGSLAPVTRDELPPLFLVSLVELMTLIKNADAASSPFLLTTLMDLLVEEKKGVPQQLSLDDPHSSLKWLPPSKPKEEHSPVHSVKNIQSALSWIFRNANQPSISILFCTDSKSLCEALISSNPRTSSIHNSINSLTLFRFPSLFNGSLAILPFQVTNQPTKQPKKTPQLPQTQSFLFLFLVIFRL